MDLTTLTDEELTAHLTQVIAEQERRRVLSTTPDTILGLVSRYRDAGGDLTALSLEAPMPEVGPDPEPAPTREPEPEPGSDEESPAPQ